MTEREKFDRWVFSPNSAGYPLRSPHDALLAWMECAEQKQAEIDALRKELEQVKELHKDALILLEQEECRHDETKEKLEHVKMHKAMLLEVMIDTLECSDFSAECPRLFERFNSSITATSKQIESYRAEIISKAKDEQRKSDEELHDLPDNLAPIGNSSYGEAYQDGWIAGTASYRDAIRNNKE